MGSRNEAELTCLAQSSLLRLRPSCSASRSRLTLSRSFCSCFPCQTHTSDLFFQLCWQGFMPTLRLPLHPSVGPAASLKWRDTFFYFLPSLLPSSGLLTISSFLPQCWGLTQARSALPLSHTPPLFSFVLGISHHNIIFYSILTHAMPNFLCWEGTFLSLTDLSTAALLQAPYVTAGGRNVHRP